MPQPAVETRNLSKHYGEFVALDNLSLHANPGEILGFIGPNGAGKTTTIKILVGLVRPTSGSASIAGFDCAKDARKVKNLIGYMPDTFGGYDNMRVREYLDFFAAAYKIPRKIRAAKIDQTLQLTGTTHMADLYTEALSHGMKQRIGLARTLLHEPQVLILDEPANGLDPLARVEMREIILRLAAAGKTVLVTSHILPELARICSTVAIITRGKLRAFGPLDQIMRALRQRRTLELLTLDIPSLTRAQTLLRSLLEPSAEFVLSESESTLRISTTLDDAALAATLRKLLEHNIPVVQFREVIQDLEDAFLTVTANT